MAFTMPRNSTNPSLVEPTVMPLCPMAKASGGNTYYYNCPWDNAELIWAEGTVTTAAATESLVLTITDGTTTAGTITATTSEAIGAHVEWSKSSAVVFARNATITVTTTDSANAGAVAPTLYFLRGR